MSTYNTKYNFDDSVVRHIIIGLLADLNNKLYFYRQIDNNTRVAIDVPFYYTITGDDQFLRDNFLFTTPAGVDCVPEPAMADGNYDKIPRGVVNLDSMSINADKLVNKRIRGSYSKMNDQGAMEGYTAEFTMIPVTLNFSVEILTSSQLDSLKITEMIIKKMYKSNYYNIEVGHLNEGTYKIASYYAMPDEYTTEKPIDFTFEDKGKYKVTFPIEANSFIPVFEFQTEMHAGKRMFEIISTVTDQTEQTFMRGKSTDQVDTIDKNDL